MDSNSISEVPHTRAPKQQRSRASFERVLGMAEEVLEERGYSAFTLGEVSRRAKVSIGSIYGRIANKDDLLRAVQVRVFERVDADFSHMVNRIRRKALPLRELVPYSFREYALHLRRHAALLSALMDAGQFDAVIRTTGQRAYRVMAADFRQLILERRGEINHPDPEKAVTTAFSVFFASSARYLGLGSSKDVVGEGDWEELVVDLGLVTLSYLLFDTRKLTHRSRRRSARR